MPIASRYFAVLAACAVLAPGSVALAQTGPSLDTTLNFIRDKLAAEGSVAYTSSVTDSSDSDTSPPRLTRSVSSSSR